MREILFRGKRIDNVEWVYGYSFPVIINNVERWFIIPCDTLCPKNITIGELQVEVDSNTIGQYTGLTDKNGVKIFEGDLLRKIGTDWDKWEENNFEGEIPTMVELTDEATMDRFPLFWLKNETFGYEGENLEVVNDWEVIGSIHDK